MSSSDRQTLMNRLKELKELEKIFLEYYSNNFEWHTGVGGLPSGSNQNLVKSTKDKLLKGLEYTRKRIQEVEKELKAIADKEDGTKGGRKNGRRKSKKMSKRSKKKKCRKTRRKSR